MGSCISKCRPTKKKKIKNDCCDMDQAFCCHVHDKLVVVSQAPISSVQKKPVSPSPSAASSTSFSSVSGGLGLGCNTSSEFSTISSLSYSSSSSSSVSVSKDRSFSNEFLWACARENPHVNIGRNVIRGSLEDQKSGSSIKLHHNKYDFPASHKKPSSKQAIPESHGSMTPKKRARANSPTLVRQKSLRKEPDRVSSPNAYHFPNRILMGSPSPSRRFTGESFRDSPMKATKEMHPRRSAVPKTSSRSYLSSSSMRRENLKTPPSPSYDSSRKSGTIMNSRDASIGNQTGPRNGKKEVGEKELVNPDVEAMVIEDIHNPLIALDCFIFL